MPLDANLLTTGTVVPAPPQPATYVGPKPLRPEIIVDQWRAALADSAGNLIGFDANWGHGGPLGPIVSALRAGARDL
jgi:hypothetical protein